MNKWVSIVTALSALIFTLGTFWWLNIRRGKLQLVGKPRSFAIAVANSKIHLNIPLAFYNSGATPVWAINIELRPASGDLPERIPFVATRPGVNPRSDDDRPFATQVVLAGRESKVICCEFIEESQSTPTLHEGRLVLGVVVEEARSWGKTKQRELGTIELQISETVLRQIQHYIAYDNFSS